MSESADNAAAPATTCRVSMGRKEAREPIVRAPMGVNGPIMELSSNQLLSDYGQRVHGDVCDQNSPEVSDSKHSEKYDKTTKRGFTSTVSMKRLQNDLEALLSR